MRMSLHTLQEVHKINDEIPGARYDKFFKHVTIQQWYIMRPQTSGHHPRVPKSRLQYTEDHVWRICTCINRHYQNYKTENGGGDRTKTRKRTGRILFYVPSHQEIDPWFHMDRTNRQLSIHIQGKRTIP